MITDDDNSILGIIDKIERGLPKFAHDKAAPLIFENFRINTYKTGLKMGNGKLRKAVSGPDGDGALYSYDSSDMTLTAGIDIKKLPYMKWQIEGVDHPWAIPSQPIFGAAGKRRKILSFIWHGKRVFFARVTHPKLKAHDIININDRTRGRLQEIFNEYVRGLMS